MIRPCINGRVCTGLAQIYSLPLYLLTHSVFQRTSSTRGSWNAQVFRYMTSTQQIKRYPLGSRNTCTRQWDLKRTTTSKNEICGRHGYKNTRWKVKYLRTGAESIHILQLGSEFGRCSSYIAGADGWVRGATVGTDAFDCVKSVSITSPAFWTKSSSCFPNEFASSAGAFSLVAVSTASYN